MQDMQIFLHVLTGEVKNVTGTLKVCLQNINSFKKYMVYPYILCYKMEAVSLFSK